ncbi:hypothetical protein RJ55_00996 [Drechmeria coniospora]|nr:hypothetical protein RJ55_00996 [Drechmeria coniospora]
MLRRPPIEGRGSTQQQKLLLAFAFLLLPWLPLADAQQQQKQHPQAVPLPVPQAGDSSSQQQQAKNEAAIRNYAAAHFGNPKPEEAPEYAATTGPVHDDDEASAASRRHHERVGQPPRQKPAERSSPRDVNHKNKPAHKRPTIVPDDASAIATLAPAQSVRAPNSPRHLRPSSALSAGVATPQNARSLEDWEVEDFVLLATVDGDLYATDRKTGKERWHLEVDQPMVETVHHRVNNSVLDDDYNPVDHYIWAVEPNHDGGLYVWVPSPDARPRSTGFTMKRLVEELAPFADEEPPVVYTGDKKTTMVTLDAATGRVLKWFGSTGSQVNEAESCQRPNDFYGKDARECSSTGTITLGRTEYTVGIQRRDGRPIATLKYAEWGPNNYDFDLLQQYHTTLDSRYIASRHDGKIYAFDIARADEPAPLFSLKFATPVARVFDICRPWDASTESNPELVVLPQPAMPSQDPNVARVRSTRIFLNHTETGSWYAMSGRAYPLIVDAPTAPATFPGWWDMASAWDDLNEDKISKALVGTHSLDARRGGDSVQPPVINPGMITDGSETAESLSDDVPEVPAVEAEEPTIVDKVKSLPQSAANSVVDFIRNPILFLVFFAALIYNEKKLRRAYRSWRIHGGSLKDILLHLTSDVLAEREARMRAGVSNESKARQPAMDETNESDEQRQVEARDVVRPLGVETTPPIEGDKADASNEPQAALSAAENKTEQGTVNGANEAQQGVVLEKKKKSHRGRRGGVKHRKGRALEASQSREDENSATTVEEAVNNAKKLGDRPSLEPDVMTVANDMQAVTGPIIRMGNIEVNTELQLGTGSNGTLVFAGKFDGREVAVKRMLIQFYDIASQETRLLRESDDHPNVIRYYSQQIRDGFLYIALERCAASLADVVERPHSYRELANAGRIDVPGVLYQITNGISHLHTLRIVHRDLKPQNILVNMGKDGKPRLLVSDFGLCKKMEDGQSSFGATTGRAAGTSGWRAPELLLNDDARDVAMVEASTHSGSGSAHVADGTTASNRRATRAIDIFSLGLVFFYVLTNGSHPFDCGDRYMREVNIRKGSHNLRPLDSLGDVAYEAKNLIASMLQADPRERPSAREVMCHPFFWSAKKRLAFLCDVSDHFEKEPREPPSPALLELERHAPQVTKGEFMRVLSRDFVDSLGKQRKYTGSRLLDLLRALRNKRNHYEDMTDSLKRTVGPLPEGYLSYWTTRFPMLLLVCWNVVYNVEWEKTDRFREYYEPANL